MTPLLLTAATVYCLYFWMFVNADAWRTLLAAWAIVTGVALYVAYRLIRRGLMVTVRLWKAGEGIGERHDSYQLLRLWWNKDAAFWWIVNGSPEVWLYSPEDGLVTDWLQCKPAAFQHAPGISSRDMHRKTQPDEVRRWNRSHRARSTAREVVQWAVVLAMVGAFTLAAVAIE